MKIVECSIGRMLVRGALLSCPRCGHRGLFRRWVVMADHCPTCGIRFERGDGFMLGVMAMNFIFSGALFSAYLVVGFALTWPQPPVVAMTAIGVVILGLSPAFLYPFAKTIWAAIDLFMRPPDVADQADAMTYLAAQEGARAARAV